VSCAVEGDAAVLVEDGAGGGLEECVGEGIALGDLGFDFFLEVVGGVFGLPDAVLEGELVDECAVGAEGLLAGAFEVVLLDEVPAVGSAALLEEVGEGGAGVAFGGMAVFLELGERLVVGLDGFVRRLEWEEGRRAHGRMCTTVLGDGADGKVVGRRGGQFSPFGCAQGCAFGFTPACGSVVWVCYGAAEAVPLRARATADSLRE
jgi:hypothetical protein